MQPLASRQLECNILSVHTHVAKVGRTWWSQNDNDVTVDGHVPSETRDGMRSWWMLLPLACRRDSLHSLRGQQGGELSLPRSLCLRTEAQIRASALAGRSPSSLCTFSARGRPASMPWSGERFLAIASAKSCEHEGRTTVQLSATVPLQLLGTPEVSLLVAPFHRQLGPSFVVLPPARSSFRPVHSTGSGQDASESRIVTFLN